MISINSQSETSEIISSKAVHCSFIMYTNNKLLPWLVLLFRGLLICTFFLFYLLMLQAVKQLLRLDAENPDSHRCLVCDLYCEPSGATYFFFLFQVLQSAHRCKTQFPLELERASYSMLANCKLHLLQIRFFHKVSSMAAPVTDTEKLISNVLEAERPSFRSSWILLIISPLLLLVVFILIKLHNGCFHFPCYVVSCKGNLQSRRTSLSLRNTKVSVCLVFLLCTAFSIIMKFLFFLQIL